jgi:hypothetical protein
MKSRSDDGLRGIKVTYNRENSNGWAEGKPGWVTLHEFELPALKLLMESLQEPELQEREIRLVHQGPKLKFYRLYVKNLALAFEVIKIARLTGFGAGAIRR